MYHHRVYPHLVRDLDGGEDEDEDLEEDVSTDEDIRELRSRQEASAAPSDIATDDAGSLALQNGIEGDSWLPVPLHTSSVHCHAVALSLPSQQIQTHIA